MEGSAPLVAAMRRAIELAKDPTVRPGANPRVGCVLLDAAGHRLAEGIHRGVGTAHAEAAALVAVAARDRARVHTAVVTLEPCDHTGRTGPCTRALIAAGVRRVAFGMTDPDPVASGGARTLRAAGVEVIDGLLAAEAATVDPAWLAATRLGRPHVTCKTATTLDGRVAAADGSSRWITGTAARADAHDERAAVDAIIVGTGTALADDPHLTVRPHGVPLPAPAQPLRVVLGQRRLPPDAKLLDDAAPTLHLPGHDPRGVLAALWDRGVRRVLIEGGPQITAAFVRAGLVDRILAYVAPALLGAGPPAVADLGVTSIEQIHRFAITDVERLGPDVRLVLLPRPSTLKEMP